MDWLSLWNHFQSMSAMWLAKYHSLALHEKPQWNGLWAETIYSPWAASALEAAQLKQNQGNQRCRLTALLCGIPLGMIRRFVTSLCPWLPVFNPQRRPHLSPVIYPARDASPVIIIILLQCFLKNNMCATLGFWDCSRCAAFPRQW